MSTITKCIETNVNKLFQVCFFCDITDIDLITPLDFKKFKDTTKAITEPIEENIYEMEQSIHTPSNVQSYAGPKKVESEVKPDQQLEG